MATEKARCCEAPMKVGAQKCTHISSFKESGGLVSFGTILKYCLTSKALAKLKLPQPSCQECNNNTTNGGMEGGRLHACMQCVFFGCWSHGHLLNHFKGENHFLGVDITHYEVYCNKCGDYVYDSDLDLIIKTETNKVNEQNQKILESTRASYHPWEATKDESTTISRNSQPVRVSKNILGLRGLINLGNTCFMNCILQSFVHNPLMRNYFLSDRHNSKECRQKYRNNLPPDSDGNKNDVCLGCEMDVLFGQVFSGATNPYTPYHILHSIWKFANYFAGYEQQDAHEFLISSLNGLHTHLERTTLMKEHDNHQNHNNHNHNSHNNNNNNNKHTNGEDGVVPNNKRTTGDKCDCIVHTIFKGTMRSEVTCSGCGFSSVTEDPFFDISLDIPKPTPPSSSSSFSSSSAAPPSAPIPPSNPPSSTEGSLPTFSTPPASPSQAPPSPTSSLPSLSSPLSSPLGSPSGVKAGGAGGGTKRSADEMMQGGGGGEGLISPGLMSPPPPSSSSYVSPKYDFTLAACLERFTQPERLGAEEKFYCSKCHTRQESTKQLSMKSLPVVSCYICFHLKRFEQLANSRHSNKIDTFIEFPSVLDMSPYTSLNLKTAHNNSNNNNNSNKNTNNNKSSKQPKSSHDETNSEDGGDVKAPDDMFSYQLFAVVNHHGKMDTGHYICYVKHDNTWYKCDDATITVATLPHVLHSKGYLLFYMKNHLQYGKNAHGSAKES